ncbi:MAG: hypothetical protein AAB645_01075 [Patescibacteria group bacterium]
MQQTRAIFIEHIQTRLIWTLLVTLVLLLSSYLYLVNRSIFNIVERKQAEETINSLNTKVAMLETDYMTLTTSKINLDYAHSLGYQNVLNSLSYIAKSVKPMAIFMPNNEI